MEGPAIPAALGGRWRDWRGRLGRRWWRSSQPRNRPRPSNSSSPRQARTRHEHLHPLSARITPRKRRAGNRCAARNEDNSRAWRQGQAERSFAEEERRLDVDIPRARKLFPIQLLQRRCGTFGPHTDDQKVRLKCLKDAHGRVFAGRIEMRAQV